MLATLISSKTRVKILIKFFINSNVRGYLRNLESEFGESCNSIRIELNRFEKAGLLVSSKDGNKKIYMANTNHQAYISIHEFIRRMVGIEFLIKQVIIKIPNVEATYITGKIARGIDSKIIDILLVGNGLEKTKINRLVEKFEKGTSRKIRHLILTNNEVDDFLQESTAFLIWKKQKILN
jgi:hypothetical protein